MKSKLILSILIIIFSTGCQRDLPKPKTKVEFIPVNYIQADENVSVFRSEENNDFRLEYFVKNQSVLVECIIPSVSFRQNTEKNRAKMIVYIDGEKKQEVTSAAFIIKGLSKGTHKIKVEVVGSYHQFQKSKEFEVEIP